MALIRRDLLFCVLFVGDEPLIRHLVMDSVKRFGVLDEWMQGVQQASLIRLRVMFFLLVDRDFELKQRILKGWPSICVVAMDAKKVNVFFQELKSQVIDPWMVDERRCEDEFVSSVIDLYLVS